MKDYKIRVANEAESKEAQELFFELGYGFFGGKEKYFLKFEYFDEWYFFSHSGDNGLTVSGNAEVFSFKLSHQEITLKQLKDLVVLKRNDVGDATHELRNGNKVYVSSNDTCFYFEEEIGWKMFTSGSNNVDIKPIEKTMSIFDTGRHVVKEYLDPDNGYVLITADEEIKGDSNWIEVPESASMLIKFPNGRDSWLHSDIKVNPRITVLWQRNKQLEELQIISESPESSIKKLKVEWFEKFLDGVNVQYRIGGAIGKKDSQWHNLTSNALKDMSHSLIEFREAPKHVTLDGITFKTQESLLKYIVNNYNFD